jgi:L-asparaginase
MKILLIQTGGTIDKDYPRVYKGYGFEIGSPAVARILEKISPNFDYEILPLMQKDSLDLTSDDREKLVQACEKSSTDKIIITHGTDTMCATASILHEIKNKVIILTGSLRPEKFSDSDAAFNLGAAVAAVQILPPGVYIAMSGRVYQWNACEKNPQNGKFIETKTGI